jgi:polynucleotide 5'-hydroxyl-kinase GRC3/NOL9
MEISAPKEWSTLLELLKEEKGIAIILGGTDTGKSTLSKFLVTNLCKQGLKVALVDADIGQSFLGPPATIGFSLFKSDPTWEVILSPPEIFFVGSITPEGHVQNHLKGVKRMVDKAISNDPQIILVDTTGFVSGEIGKELKRKKIDLISPHFIIALQKENEIEPILEPYKEDLSTKIIRLPLSPQVRPKSMEDRKSYRTNKFRDYFKFAAIHELATEELQMEGEVFDPNGELLPLEWVLRINSLLLGLKDNNDETLALGVIRNYLEEKKILRVFTPLMDVQKVKTLQLSSLKVIPLFEEERI